MEKIQFQGTISSVKARIRLLRSFDQIPTHQYQGYTLVIDGVVDGQPAQTAKIAIGPKAHEKHQFRIGDRISGEAVKVTDTETEWAEYYKVSALDVDEHLSEVSAPPGPDGGIAPSLEKYRENGHFRLHRETCETKCSRCPFGLTMATQIILDHWDQSKVKWRFETHCYGPRGCPNYKSGPPYRVQGRKPGMVYVDNDVERAESDQENLQHD